MSGLPTLKSKPGYGVEGAGESVGTNADPHGMDLTGPRCVAGCHVCGERELDATGHWSIGLDAERRPVCKRHR